MTAPVGTRLTCSVCGSAAVVVRTAEQASLSCCSTPLLGTTPGPATDSGSGSGTSSGTAAGPGTGSTQEPRE
jgi:hypothetical protein